MSGSNYAVHLYLACAYFASACKLISLVPSVTVKPDRNNNIDTIAFVLQWQVCLCMCAYFSTYMLMHRPRLQRTVYDLTFACQALDAERHDVAKAKHRCNAVSLDACLYTCVVADGGLYVTFASSPAGA